MTMKKRLGVFAVIILIMSLHTGCVEHQKDDSLDLSLFGLETDDVPTDFQKLNEQHITEPYTVSEGKLFEGLQIDQKYEVYYIKNVSVFLIQQIAFLNSEEDISIFMDMLSSNTSIPGLQDDWSFSEISIPRFGDESVLLKNQTEIDGNSTTIFLLAFHVDEVVNIFVSASVEKEILLQYAELTEQRIKNDMS